MLQRVAKWRWLSKGGLTVPHENWLLLCHKMMDYFNKYNKGEFKYDTSVLKRMTRKMCKKFPDLQLCIIKSFVKLAIKIRCKHLSQGRNKKLPGKASATQIEPFER